jgi:biotin transport system substrate-specific component
MENKIADSENSASVSAKRRTITGLTLTALFGALIAAGTFISIPRPFSPVPIVLQNLFALLAGLILGPVYGSASVALYLIAGIIGAPVFAGATGGLARVLGPTGGYLIGYPLSAFTAGLILRKPNPEKKAPLWLIIIAVFAGLLVVYVPGVAWLKLSTGRSWAASVAGGFTPFIIGDLVKGIIAVIIAPRLRRAAADILSR